MCSATSLFDWFKSNICGSVTTEACDCFMVASMFMFCCFLWRQMLWENGINGILADEMGLGKTIQCIAHIAMMIEKKVTGPFLVVAPLSTLPNWISEFKRFTPEVTGRVFRTSIESGAMCCYSAVWTGSHVCNRCRCCCTMALSLKGPSCWRRFAGFRDPSTCFL